MDLQDISPNTPLNKFNSLETVELVMAIEEAFDIEIPDEDAEKFQIIGDIVDYVAQHGRRSEPRESLLKKLWNVLQEVLFGGKKSKK